MAAKREKTSTPGVYRRGSRYSVIYRDPDGRQRQESARTLDEARRLRTRRSSSVDDGSYQPLHRVKFADYAREWITRYQGSGRRGFTEDTRDEYRRDLERYGIAFLGRHRLDQIGSREIGSFIAWLCDEQAQGRRRAEEHRDLEAKRRRVPPHSLALNEKPVRLADASVRRILAPVRSCLGAAKREDLIRHNPCAGAALPSRDEQHRIEQGEDDLDDRDVKALSTEQLATLLERTPADHQLLMRLLAATGLRIGEALALRWGDLVLDGTAPPVVRVRRSLRHGHFKPPKSKYGRRQVPIDFELVRELRAARKARQEQLKGQDRTAELLGDDDELGTELLARELVFCTSSGQPLDYSNLRKRVLLPAARQAGVPWAGFHTLRHTCATRLFGQGRNAVQVQRWLGHHSAAFTLSVYVHLLDEDLGAPLALPECQQVATQATESTRNSPDSIAAEVPQLRAITQ